MKKRAIVYFLHLFSIFIFLVVFPSFVFAAAPVGYLDTAQTNCTQIVGWTGDPDSVNTPLTVDVYANGPAGVGQMVARGTASLFREGQVCRIIGGGSSCDICDASPAPTFAEAPQCYHGFVIPRPDVLGDGLPHTIYAYGLDSSGGENTQLPGSGMSLNCPEVSDITTSVNLTNLGIPKLNLYISYEKSNAVGDSYPNYDYSAHVIKINNNDWRMFFGSRCRYDDLRDCRIPKANMNPNTCSWWGGSCYEGSSGNGEDGDHIRMASSTDGINWSWGRTPIIRPGMYDVPSVPPESYDYHFRMDPTVIWWAPEQKYYMYYETLELNPQNCGNQTAGCGKILYATSTDLIHWTKSQNKVTINDTNSDSFKWPKAIVVGDEVWLYYGRFSPDLEGNLVGPRFVKSRNPVIFDVNSDSAIFQSGPQEWGQHAILWPNDLNRRLFVQIANDWEKTSETGYRVPTLVFSQNGADWTYSETGAKVAFPPVMNSLQHEFCNIATEVNGGLNPLPNNSNKIETFFYCATFNGLSAWGNSDLFFSDISVGKLQFWLDGPTPTSPVVECSPLGNIDCSEGVNSFDLSFLIPKFWKTFTVQTREDLDDSLKINSLDLAILMNNFGR